MEWISVKDRPLFKNIGEKSEMWECTPDAEKEFMAAIEQTDGTWWIHHCVVEDQIGLMVVGDTENEPAGYGLEDVEYFYHISPPESNK